MESKSKGPTLKAPKKRFPVILFLFLVPLSAQAQIQQIRMAVGAPRGTPVWRGAEFYRDEINKQLDGRARIEITTPAAPDVFAAIQAGEVDLAVGSTTLLAAAKTPILALFDLPFFFQNLTELAAVQRGAIGDAMLNAVNADRLVGLAYWNTGMSHLFGSKQILKIDDLKGMRFRTTVSPPAQIAARSLGATTTRIPLAEVAAALNTRAIDIVETPPVFVSQGVLPLTPQTYTRVNYRPVVAVVVTSEKFWKTARFRVQSVLVDRARAVAIRVNDDAEKADRTATEWLQKEFKTAIATPTQFKALSEAALPSWRAVDPLQKDRFLDAALSARNELRRVKYVVPEKRSQVLPSTPPKEHVFFATDRVDEKDTEPAYRFGGARGELTWGRADVYVDPNRPLGSGDTDTVRLANIVAYPSASAFIADVKAQLGPKKLKAVLVYIHGYKTPFKTAVESAAQIAADTKFDGATVIFSWPSDGALLRYLSDEEEVQLSKENFITTLRALSEIGGLQKIHVITHSMGGRLAANSFEWLITQPTKGRPRLHHLILAAPDVRVAHFRQAARGMQGLSKNVTLYSSKWDQALQCSLILHGAPRAGQAGSNIVVLKDIQTVDASAVEKPSFPASLSASIPCMETGHSYISQNPAVLSDLYELLAYDTAPNRRQRLHERQKDGLPYWMLR